MGGGRQGRCVQLQDGSETIAERKGSQQMLIAMPDKMKQKKKKQEEIEK